MENGQIKIAKDVIVIITDLAIDEAAKQDDIGKRVRNKGIAVTYDEDQLILTIDLSVKYGKKIPEVAEEIQRKVKLSVENMTGMTVKAVNINITGLNFDKTNKED